MHISNSFAAAPYRVALAGLGAIGQAIARRLDEGIPGCSLAAVAARDERKAKAFVDQLAHPPALAPLPALAQHADIVVECAPAALLAQIAEPVLSAGKQLVVLSVGALLEHPQLEKLAARYGGRILVPTGALIGLDAVAAAAQGTIY